MSSGGDLVNVEATPSARLTNDDFRKLLTTPRVPPAGSGSSGASLATATFATPAIPATGADKSRLSGSGGTPSATPNSVTGNSERSDLRRKKKNFYAALKKQEDNKLQELSEKYRDRARERRDGINPDYQNVSTPGHSNTNAYRAVAPDVKSGVDAAERRKRIIQESKFLGGDMEHTHLVKGLDYALLQKVRSELQIKEQEERELAAAAAASEKLEAEVENANKDEEDEEEITEKKSNKELLKDGGGIECGDNSIKGAMARNIYNMVQQRRSKEVLRVDLFAPGRMAYVIDLEEDAGDSDIPTTLIRSKFEVPTNRDNIATLTTNDIIINKLSQILSYLRAGGRNKKNKKRDKDKPLFYENDLDNREQSRTVTGTNKEKGPALGQSIYDDIGEYVPSIPKNSNKNDLNGNQNNSKSSSQVSSNKPNSYFGEGNNSSRTSGDDFVTTLPPPPKVLAKTSLASRLANEPEGYAECYPGLEEMNDAIDDSDDEVDYTKMDLGNKKGPIGRWDFDTQEEYSDYMSAKEALPKAAFQYGVKMQDGRKTRKHKTDKNEKAELDREWQKIQV